MDVNRMYAQLNKNDLDVYREFGHLELRDLVSILEKFVSKAEKEQKIKRSWLENVHDLMTMMYIQAHILKYDEKMKLRRSANNLPPLLNNLSHSLQRITALEDE